MSHLNIFMVLLLFSTASLSAQVGIGTENPSPRSSLDVRSQINGVGDFYGFMPPRIPDENARDLMAPLPEDEGLLIYVVSTETLEIWNGQNWELVRKISATVFADELFISKYVQDDDNFNAIEIANFTGVTKNLSNYRIAIGQGKNPLSIFIALDNLSLPHGSVYVVKHPNAAAITANQISADLTYSGQDAVVLQDVSGTVTYDVLGKVELDWPYGVKRLLQKRKGKGPSLLCDLNDYQIFAPNQTQKFGSHSF
ncbi:MAG: lamin tail domain-containing protein [Bacteroidetes bacterium]|nr:lamin tail domain-containing protein [Bacteroidota bacterium]